MAKKAKLDILEITLDETSDKTHVDHVDLVEQIDSDLNEKQIALDLRSRLKHWIHKLFFWIIVISILFIGSLAGILYNIYQAGDERGQVGGENHTAKGSSVQSTGDTIYLAGFMIDQKDNRQNIRIVFCDLALSMVKSEKIKNIDNNQIPMRNAIYAILKKEEIKEGLSVEGRGRLKERIKNELNRLLGDPLIESVHFTRYEII